MNVLGWLACTCTLENSMQVCKANDSNSMLVSRANYSFTHCSECVAYIELAHKCIKITSNRNEIWAWELYHSTSLIETVKKFSALKHKRMW